MHSLAKIGVVVFIIGLVSIFFLAPVIPLGATGPNHYPPVQVSEIFCDNHSCPITPFYGHGYGSISYALFGIGEYYYIFQYNVGVPNVWTFIW